MRDFASKAISFNLLISNLPYFEQDWAGRRKMPNDSFTALCNSRNEHLNCSQQFLDPNLMNFSQVAELPNAGSNTYLKFYRVVISSIGHGEILF